MLLKLSKPLADLGDSTTDPVFLELLKRRVTSDRLIEDEPVYALDQGGAIPRWKSGRILRSGIDESEVSQPGKVKVARQDEYREAAITMQKLFRGRQSRVGGAASAAKPAAGEIKRRASMVLQRPPAQEAPKKRGTIVLSEDDPVRLDWTTGFDVQLDDVKVDKMGGRSIIKLRALPASFVLRDAEGYLPGLMLLKSAEKGDEKVVRSLLQMGVSVREADADCNTALHFASLRNHLGVVRLLLDHGADPAVGNRNQMSPWDIALCMRNATLRRIFRPSESDLDVGPPHSYTPLCFNAYEGSMADVRRCDADVAMRAQSVAPCWHVGYVQRVAPGDGCGDGCLRRTFLQSLCAPLRTTTACPLRTTTVSAQSNLDALSHCRYSPLCRSVEAGSKIDEASANGITPMMLAARENHVGVVAYLLDKGANPMLRSAHGCTPIGMACESGNFQVVKVRERACLPAGPRPSRSPQPVLRWSLFHSGSGGGAAGVHPARRFRSGFEAVAHTERRPGEHAAHAGVRKRPLTSCQPDTRVSDSSGGEPRERFGLDVVDAGGVQWPRDDRDGAPDKRERGCMH